MADQPKCPDCGTALPASGFCPKCLIGVGLDAGLLASPPADAVPSRKARPFAGHELVRQIGCGAMGVVYEAHEIALHRTVALKLIFGNQVYSPAARRRFLIGAEAAARLDHPNVVPVYQVGEYEDQPFLTMKLIRGGTLHARMKSGGLCLSADRNGATNSTLKERQRAIARLMAQVAGAVHHAHAQNVIHRDLKPANILMDGEGSPQLTDFGLAKILDDQSQGLTEPGAVQGTLPYMAPEQVRGETVTAAADTYSLGVILYELLTGQLPFRGTTQQETIRLIEKQPPTRPRKLNRHIDRDLETISLKCMEKKVVDRYSTTADLVEDLDLWLQGKPIKARPLGSFRRLGRWVKRNPLGTGLIASLSFGLAVTVAFAIVYFQKNEAKIKADLDRIELISQQLDMQTDELWRNRDRTNLVIKAERLADLNGRPLAEPLHATRLTFAVNIRGNPSAQAIAYAPLLEQLQETMGRSLGQPIIFDLKFCKSPQAAYHEVVGTNTDFQRLGAVSYLKAQQLSPGVQAVAQEDAGKEGVIAVRKDSQITNLTQFAGRSFAGSDDLSTIGQWAKVHLVRAGVRQASLSPYKVFDEAPVDDDVAEHSRSESIYPTTASGVSALQEVSRGSLFREEDLSDPSEFDLKLRAGADPVSRFLWSQFATNAQEVLTNRAKGAGTPADRLVQELNRIIRTGPLFDAPRFAGVSLSSNTLALLSRKPQGDDLLRLNRLLLEDAYPQIAKRQQFDGASVTRWLFNRRLGNGLGLREVHHFASTPNVYVARAGLDAKVVQAFQQAMTSLNDSDGLVSRLPLRPPVHAFQLPDEQGLKELRAALANEVRVFEGQVPGSPDPPEADPR